MTYARNPKFRIASRVLAGMTIGFAVTALAAAPVGIASADDLSPWTTTHGGSRDTTFDAADYVVWRKNDGTAAIGDPVTFTVSVTNSG